MQVSARELIAKLQDLLQKKEKAELHEVGEKEHAAFLLDLEETGLTIDDCNDQ